MKTTRPPENYTTFTSQEPVSPPQIQPYIEARKIVTELDRQLKIIRAVDNTRLAFKDFY